MRKAVYAGSFDPLTKGHVWMIETGIEMFDELIVAIGNNPDKSYTFSVDERLDLLRASLPGAPNLSSANFEHRFLVDYAHDQGAKYILRGIRSENDYEYERVMRYINADLKGEITTVFLMPPRQIAELRSSMVKSMVGPKGWEKPVREYVPQPVFDALVNWASHEPAE